MLDAIIIGAGPAGLTAGFKLLQKNLEFLVLEAQDQPGGNVRTLAHQGYKLETGPHTFMGANEFVFKLVSELNLDPSLMPASPAAENRYIFRAGKLHPLPNGLIRFLKTPLLSASAKLRLTLEPLIPNRAKPLETAWEFFVRRFGEEAATYIMSPFISGIYAGNAKQLGARASFPKFWNFEKESGSMIIGAAKFMYAKRKRLKQEGITLKKGLFSFKDGLGALTKTIAEKLGKNLLCSATVETIVRDTTKFIVRAQGQEFLARSIICAAPPPSASALLSGLAPGAGKIFNALPMSPVALIHWSQNAIDFPPGFGFLMPRLYQLRVLGTLFPSQLFPNRAPQGQSLFASFYGGMTDPEAVELSDDELTATLLKEHQEIFARKLGPPEMLKILRYPGAIPQLLPDHPEKIAALLDQTKKIPGLFLAGNYLTGVGLEHAVISGYNSAEQCLKFVVERFKG